MSKVKVTDEQFAQAMRDAVATRGRDYVYTRDECAYRDELGAPSCLIGVALDKLGIVVKLDHEGLSALALLPMYLDGVSQQHIVAADSAQMVQDEGRTWGEALAVFERAKKEEV